MDLGHSLLRYYVRCALLGLVLGTAAVAAYVSSVPAPTPQYNSLQPNRGRERRRNIQRAPTSTAAALPVFTTMTTAPTLAQQCTGGTITGVTLTRSGGQTCGKADGTVVKLTSNQPALEANGLHVEAAGTNIALQSEQIGGASPWVVQGGSLTTNVATAPDGTMTAERYQFTTALNTNTYQSATATSGTVFSASVYLQQTATNPGSYASVAAGFSSGTATCTCSTSDGRACAVYNNGTFCGASIVTNGTWCRLAIVATASAAQTTVFEYVRPGRFGQTETGDAYFWGAQLESGPYSTSYIPTTTVSATRNATQAALSNLTLSSTPSFAATVTSAGSQAAGVMAMTGTASTDYLQLANVDTTGAFKCSYTGASSTTSVQYSTVLAANTPTRLACYSTGAVLGVCSAGVCQTTAGALSPGASTTRNALGFYRVATTQFFTGWLTNICIDSTSGGCR